MKHTVVILPDVDECATQKDNCDERGTGEICRNVPNSFVCECSRALDLGLIDGTCQGMYWKTKCIKVHKVLFPSFNYHCIRPFPYNYVPDRHTSYFCFKIIHKLSLYLFITRSYIYRHLGVFVMCLFKFIALNGTKEPLPTPRGGTANQLDNAVELSIPNFQAEEVRTADL